MQKNMKLGLAGVVVGCLSLLGCLGPQGLPVYKGEQRFHRTIPVGKITRIDTVVKNGNVTLTGYDGREIEIKGKVIASATFEDRAQELADLVRLTVEDNGDWIKVTPILPDSFDPRAFKLEMKVLIPQGFIPSTQPSTATQPGRIQTVNVRTRNGSVDIQSVHAVVNVISEGGSITARHLDGPINLRTETGSVTAEKLQGTLTVETDTGNINLTAITGILDIFTDTGIVTFTTKKGTWMARSVKGDTRTGKVHITQPRAKYPEVKPILAF
jgi:hypothetical protein